MNPIRSHQNYRDSLLVTNVTNKTFTISDLTSVPAISPNETVDLLAFENRGKISQSLILPQLLNIAWLTAVRTSLGYPDVTVTATNIKDIIAIADRTNTGNGGTVADSSWHRNFMLMGG